MFDSSEPSISAAITAPSHVENHQAPNVKEKLKEKIELFQRFAVNAHFSFDQAVWGQNQNARLSLLDPRSPSYHNDHHIEAMIKATRAFLRGPFALEKELEKWNSTLAEGQQLSMDDLEVALELASSGHDLGNLTGTATVIVADEMPTLDYSAKYESAPADDSVERRSADITNRLIDHFFSSEAEKAIMAKLKPLVRHLTMQTVFDPGQTAKDLPFGQFMQYCDQIGTYFFSDQSRRQSVAGLLNEMKVRGDPPPNLAAFLNFPSERDEILIPDSKMRTEVNAILTEFGTNGNNIIPEDILGPVDRPADYQKDISILLKI